MTLEDFITETLLKFALGQRQGLPVSAVWENDPRCQSLRRWLRRWESRPQPNNLVVPQANYNAFRPEGGTVSRYSRRYVGQPCPYCREIMQESGPRRATSDHIKPRSKGGSDKVRNRLACCFQCNSDKRDMHLRTWLDQLQHEDDPRHFNVLLTYFDLRARGLGDLTL